jgi:hypothetical protein
LWLEEEAQHIARRQFKFEKLPITKTKSDISILGSDSDDIFGVDPYMDEDFDIVLEPSSSQTLVHTDSSKQLSDLMVYLWLFIFKFSQLLKFYF